MIRILYFVVTTWLSAFYTYSTVEGGGNHALNAAAAVTCGLCAIAAGTGLLS